MVGRINALTAKQVPNNVMVQRLHDDNGQFHAGTILNILTLSLFKSVEKPTLSIPHFVKLAGKLN